MSNIPKLKENCLLLVLILLAGTVCAQDGSSADERAFPSRLPAAADQNEISLAGIWKFKLDPFETGISSNGVQLLPGLPEEITLPGSTDQAGKGNRTQGMTSLRLTRQFEYKGPAWYEKEIFVPAEWNGKVIQLFLERVHWESRVWVNGRPAGKRESLSAPHIYTISSLLRPGKKNTIRVRVTNEKIYDIAYSHAISAETQTNWNGITGNMSLRAFDPVHIHDVQVYPNAAQKLARVTITVRNITGKKVDGNIYLAVNPLDQAGHPELPRKKLKFSGADSLLEVQTTLSLGQHALLWDEFTPALYRLYAELTAQPADAAAEPQDEGETGEYAPARELAQSLPGDSPAGFKDSRETVFGLRDIGTEGTRFTINGRTAFIRATVNCAEFPITGYPPTDVDSWLHILQTCKDYGLNGMRFHSWCPPEAAFKAANRLGMYLQVENSDWRFTVGEDSATNRFLREEADRILETYGNHPSFVFFAEGNELVGPTVKPFLSGLVSRWKEKDPRHLYSGSAAYPIVPENQFNVFYGARPQRWKEGLKGRFNVRPLNTEYDYGDYVAKFEVPMITHEVGQWCVYPNFKEIPKYTGVLKPYNYQLFRESLRAHHMLDQAEQFTMASGKFQVIQKKEEVESYLRTPGMAGYHLLQLNDFPGQGTSPVGVVDIFWDPKPYVTAEEFSVFQAERVPLLRTSSFTWTTGQVFRGTAQFANFGALEMKNVRARWSLRYPDGRLYAEGDFTARDIPLGSPFDLGELSVPLNKIEEATRLDLRIQVDSVHNNWSIWVYPAKLPSISPENVLVSNSWDQKTRRTLERGGTVLLLADTANIDSDVPAGFSGISWNAVWSGMPPNLLGILCDPQHPALTHFPTQFHSNWQWWDIVARSRPMLLDHMPASFKPLVQMIPDWNKNNKIGLLFEARVGEGRLLLTSVDLEHEMDQRPVARQFLYSLQRYAGSEAFSPETRLTFDQVDRIFKKMP